MIKNVYHVPSFNINLKSISKITKDLNCLVTFYYDFCILQYLATKRMIGLGRMHNGLFHLSTLTHKQIMSMHQRLGHHSTLLMNHLISSFSNIVYDFNKVCDVCHLAKQTKLPCGLSSISTKRPFDLIHCDIWGAFRVKSLT